MARRHTGSQLQLSHTVKAMRREASSPADGPGNIPLLRAQKQTFVSVPQEDPPHFQSYVSSEVPRIASTTHQAGQPSGSSLRPAEASCAVWHCHWWLEAEGQWLPPRWGVSPARPGWSGQGWEGGAWHFFGNKNTVGMNYRRLGEKVKEVIVRIPEVLIHKLWNHHSWTVQLLTISFFLFSPRIKVRPKPRDVSLVNDILKLWSKYKCDIINF